MRHSARRRPRRCSLALADGATTRHPDSSPARAPSFGACGGARTDGHTRPRQRYAHRINSSTIACMTGGQTALPSKRIVSVRVQPPRRASCRRRRRTDRLPA